RGPRRLAPSAMFKATLYAALRHWSPRANRSALGSFEIASLDWTASATASCHARSLRKSPMPKNGALHLLDQHRYCAGTINFALIQRNVVASYSLLSLPLNRRGWFRTDIVDHAIYSPHFIDDPAADLPEHLRRKRKPIRRHTVATRHRPQCDHMIVGAEVSHHPD